MGNLTRRDFGATVVAGVPWSIARAKGGEQDTSGKRRPNVVFICSDQHSGPVMGCSGHDLVHTPNMDRLAARGVHFRNAYSSNPVCVPARASLMTGMFASDVRSYCNSTPFDGHAPTWATYLRDAGYYCWGTGKLDVVPGRDYGLIEYKTHSAHAVHPDICSLFRRPLCYRIDERRQVNGDFSDRKHSDETTTEDGLRFLREEAPQRQPWAMWLGLVLPHPPFVAHQRFKATYPPFRVTLPNIPADYLQTRHVALQALSNYHMISVPIADERVRMARAAYYAMVTELDELIGKVIQEIDRAGQWRNTIIVYTSDHGEMLGDHGLWFKNTLLEGAARVPMIVAGAGLAAGKVVDNPVGHVDLVATLLDLAQVPIPAKLRGRSLLPLAAGQMANHDSIAFSESHGVGNCTGSFMIRKGDWKFIYFSNYHSLLFNLKADPGELNNLANVARYGDVKRELHGVLMSLINPDEVTEQAFRAQESRLAELVRTRSQEQLLHEEFAHRLGEGEARVLLKKIYRS